jgi:hypothetical protein
MLILLLAGCRPAAVVVTATPSSTPGPTGAPTATASVTPSPTPTPTPTQTPSPSPTPITLWIAPGVPEGVRAAFEPLLAGGAYRLVEGHGSANLRLELSSEDAPVRAQWVYAAVAPFPTLANAVAWADVQRFWSGEPGALAYLSNNSAPPTLVVSADVLETLTALLGPPDPAAPVQMVPGDAVHLVAWQQYPASWSIVPFHRLRPEWKVLAVDGVSVLERQADLTEYPLAVEVGLDGAPEAVDRAASDLAISSAWQSTNREPTRMTTLVMTGVTALTRATAWRMETASALYPARDILPLLQGADILHISNEVAFAVDCPFPNPSFTSANMRFCARDAYFDLLTHIGADVIELTGNHVNDWGTAALAHSLDLYTAAGMGTFGGGRNLEAAHAPYITAHGGNTFAFVGCNPVGPPAAFAMADAPGAAPCDYAALHTQIAELAQAVDIVVVTQQYWEFDHAAPTPKQVEDFANLARAGADIVSGSQAHTPQGFAFVEGAFVHYGLGNLFFDQMQSLALRELLIDQHVIYDGRHISTVLFTGLIEDYARPRPMTAAERRDFLARVFAASGWYG